MDFLQILQRRHPYKLSFVDQIIISIFLQLLSWCIQYNATLDRVITTPDCILYQGCHELTSILSNQYMICYVCINNRISQESYHCLKFIHMSNFQPPLILLLFIGHKPELALLPYAKSLLRSQQMRFGLVVKIFRIYQHCRLGNILPARPSITMWLIWQFLYQCKFRKRMQLINFETELYRMASQRAETLVEIMGTVADIRGTTK